MGSCNRCFCFIIIEGYFDVYLLIFEVHGNNTVGCLLFATIEDTSYLKNISVEKQALSTESIAPIWCLLKITWLIEVIWVFGNCIWTGDVFVLETQKFFGLTRRNQVTPFIFVECSVTEWEYTIRIESSLSSWQHLLLELLQSLLSLNFLLLLLLHIIK